MKNPSGKPSAGERSAISLKIGDAAACNKAISAAIAKRANELAQPWPCHPRSDQENWHLAEKEVLKPLCCGILDSKDEAIVSIFCSALGTKDLTEIEVCVEPHRVTLVGRGGSDGKPAENTTTYRALPFVDEIDPSSTITTLKHGTTLEIRLRKVSKQELMPSRAA